MDLILLERWRAAVLGRSRPVARQNLSMAASEPSPTPTTVETSSRKSREISSGWTVTAIAAGSCLGSVTGAGSHLAGRQ